MDPNRQGARASYVALSIFVALWILVPSAVRRFNREAFVEFQAPALHLLAKSRDLPVAEAVAAALDAGRKYINSLDLGGGDAA